MSPELIAPEKFGFEICLPSKSSDCYALGMVIYEIISGNVPFHKIRDTAVFLKIVEGERPHREAGFAESLWKKMEQCWVSEPIKRPSVEDVLLCLERCSNRESPQDSGDESDATTASTEEDAWLEATDELEDEEERLIMNGGVGIPIGPVSVLLFLVSRCLVDQS
jgi:serine/threonine protein kinase